MVVLTCTPPNTLSTGRHSFVASRKYTIIIFNSYNLIYAYVTVWKLTKMHGYSVIIKKGQIFLQVLYEPMTDSVTLDFIHTYT